MRTFTCRELGGDCDHRVSGETDEEVKIRMMQHAMDAHRAKLAGMSRSEMDRMQARMDEILRAR